MKRKVHEFDNGVRVYDDHLLPIQRDRYKQHNVHEIEEEDIIIKILHAIPPDGCYVNIGAAIGYYPLLAKRLAPELTVHAVEPLELHRAYFIENIALNKLNESSLTIHSEGISSSDGEADFFVRSYGSSIRRDSGNNYTERLKSNIKGHCKAILVQIGLREPEPLQKIKTKTLDNLFKEIGRSIDLCQMDVQGLELDVLEGAQHVLEAGEVKTFLIGTHSQTLHERCISRLKKDGYVVEYDNFNTLEQPDGILVASKNCQRLGNKNKS